MTSITKSFARHVALRSANPGVDYGAPTGTDVLAPESGLVTGAQWSSLVGWWIHIDHDNGWGSDLLHNSKLLVGVGARVQRGQHIAESGGTGSAATGPHIHWSLRPKHGQSLQNSGNVNGEGYLGGFASTSTIESWIGDDYIRRLQGALGVTVDGDFGPASTKALQTKIGTPADGVFGPASVRALQAFIGALVDGIVGVQTVANFKAAIDRGKFGTVAGGTGDVTAQFIKDQLGADYVKKLQTQLGGLTVDGIVGAATIKAWQTKVGANADGAWDHDSNVKLQTFLGISRDGLWGPGTTAAIKAALDANKFAGSGGTTTPTDPTPPPATLPVGTVNGIDIAWPQTQAFDWATIKATQKFVIIKAAGAEDPAPNQIYGPAGLFEQHYANARAAGIERIGYYFFNNGTLEVKPQADKFIEVVSKKIKPGDIVCLDIEPSGAATAFNPDQALEFASYIEQALGVKTFIYINRTQMRNQNWSAVVAAGHPLWLAVLDGLATSVSVPIVGWSHASIVQYVVQAGVPGYPGNIDVNYGVSADLAKYGFVKFPEPEPAPDFDRQYLTTVLTQIQGLAVAGLEELED